jgi:hypothetical protein
MAVFHHTKRALSVIGELVAVATLMAGGAYLVGLATLV